MSASQHARKRPPNPNKPAVQYNKIGEPLPTGLRLPPRPQRQVHTAAALVRLDCQHLVQLDDIALEPQPRSRHIETPDPRGAEPDLGDRLIPVLDEIGAPVAEGQCVVRPQVLLVEYLQTGVLSFGDDSARPRQ